MILALALSASMVDMENHYSAPSPLNDAVLDSPLCRDFIGGMGDLQDISQSMDEDALSSFEVTENQSSGLGSGSESSTALGTQMLPLKHTLMC